MATARLKYLLPIHSLLDSHIAIRYMKHFVNKEHSEENLEFWVDAEALRRCTDTIVAHKLVRKIWNLYFKPGAPLQLTLDGDTLDDMKSEYEQGEEHWHIHMFADAQNVVQKVLKQDVHLRFVDSIEYQQMCHRFALRLGRQYRSLGSSGGQLTWPQLMENPIAQEAVRKYLESIHEDDFLHLYLSLRLWKYRPQSRKEMRFEALYLYKRYFSPNVLQPPIFCSKDDIENISKILELADIHTFDIIYDKLKNHLIGKRYEEFILSSYYKDLISTVTNAVENDMSNNSQKLLDSQSINNIKYPISINDRKAAHEHNITNNNIKKPTKWRFFQDKKRIEKKNSENNNIPKIETKSLEHSYRRIPLEDILNDPQFLRGFQVFAKSEHSEENILFLRDVQQFKKTPKLSMAQQMFKMYFRDGAQYGLAVSDSIKLRIKNNLISGNKSENVFDDAYRNVINIVRSDSYQRFIKSNIYVTIMELRNEKRKSNHCIII